MISAILPACNEEATVAAVVRAVSSHVDTVIVVDNGSTDGTAVRARDAGADVVSEPVRGYGRACLRGVQRARELGADVLLFLDADGSDDPADIPRVLEPVRSGAADLALGSRAADRIEPGSMTTPQRLGNWLAPLLMRWTAGAPYHDLPPMKALALTTFDDLGVRDQGHGFTIELLLKAHARGLRIAEVPAGFRRRAGGTSKVSGTVLGTLRASAKILGHVTRYAVQTRSGWFRVLLMAAALLTALSWSPSAKAYPWMIRHTYFGCSTCHTDVSGGGLLTAYGRAQSDVLLPMRYGGEGGSGDSISPLWGLVSTPDWVSAGGSYRHMTLFQPSEDNLKTFPMQMDLYGEIDVGIVSAGGSLGLSRVKAGSPFARRAQVTTNQGDGWNLISRTHFVGVQLTPSIKLRAGRLELPFGVRIPEHTMWVRRETRTDRESSQEHGLSVSYDAECWRGELMAIAGNYQMGPDQLRERGYSGYAELRASEMAAVGASSLVLHAGADFQTLEEDVTRQVHGLFARAALFESLSVFAEGDVLLRSRRDLGYVGFLQFDLEFIQGLHALGTAEILDRGYQDTGDPYDTIRIEPGFGHPALGGWLSLDWFFFHQLEARFDTVARQQEPLTFLAQLHVLL